MKRKYKKSKGKKPEGWEGEPTRHGLAGSGVETVINDKWRFNVNDYVRRNSASGRIEQAHQNQKLIEKEYEYIEKMLDDKSFDFILSDYSAKTESFDMSLREIFNHILSHKIYPKIAEGDYTETEYGMMIPSELGIWEVKSINKEDKTFTTVEGFKFEYEVNKYPEYNNAEVIIEYIPHNEGED